MAQIKKESVRKGILESAFKLIAKKGYQATSIPDIARDAGMTPGNIYRYYGSKFELFYDVLQPWLIDKISQLETRVAAIDSATERLRTIFTFLWIELPRMENNFEINLMEALATKKPGEVYSRQLLNSCKERIAVLLKSCLPEGRTKQIRISDLTHIAFMCHDGFVLNTRLVDETGETRRQIDSFVAMIVK
jgi:AcrR family transcriptional regulator